MSPKAIAITRTQSCHAAEQINIEPGRNFILRAESHAEGTREWDSDLTPPGSDQNETGPVSASPARDAMLQSHCMADAQTEQVSNYSLLLFPDPELSSMEGAQGKQLVDIHSDSGASACVPQRRLLNRSAGEQENSERHYDGLEAISRVAAPPSRQPRYKVVQVKRQCCLPARLAVSFLW